MFAFGTSTQKMNIEMLVAPSREIVYNYPA